MKPGRGLVWSVGLLLGITGVALGAVAFSVVRASRDESVRSGLDYRQFLRSVDELMLRSVDDSIIGFQRVEARLTDGRRVAFDTLVIRADLARLPSFGPGGFLNDQVARYNRFQRERLALARTRPEAFDLLEAHNPSIFVAARDGDGRRRLGRTSAAWSMRVRSPFEGTWGGEIVARDARRGAGLLSPGASVSLRRPTRLYRTVAGRRQRCEFEPGPMEVRAFCLSEQRVPQAIFRLAADEGTPRTAVAGWSDLWVDGRRVSAGDSIPVREGSVLQLDPLEPMMLGELWDGILSSEQWINGRNRRVGAFDPPLDLFAPLENATAGGPGHDSDAPVEVSLHAGASRALSALLQDYSESRLEPPLDFGLIVLARIPDGEIVAVAEVGRRRTRGRSQLLEPVAPGSAVKPILAAAILSEAPELGSLRIPARSGDVRSVLGLPDVPARRAFESALNCAPPDDGWIDLRYFVRCSSNEFAASLTLAGVFGSGAWRAVAGGGQEPRAGRFELGGRTYAGLRAEGGAALTSGRIARSTLLTSSLATGLAERFDVAADPVVADRVSRSSSIWDGLRLSDGTPVVVPFEGLASVSRPVLLGSVADDGTDLGLVYRYAVGAWENRWTLLGLTEAFSRVASDRRVRLRFARGSPRLPAAEAEPLGLAVGPSAWYPQLIGGLRDVPRDGTAAGLAAAWREIGVPGMLLAKTGTLAERGEGGVVDDLFIKSLLFAVGDPAADDTGRLTCGLTGGIYLRFAEGPRRGSLPSHQVAFARERLGAFLHDHWESFGACPGTGGGAAGG